MSVYIGVILILIVSIFIFYSLKGKNKLQGALLFFWILLFDMLRVLIDDYNILAIVIIFFVMVFLRNKLIKFKFVLLAVLIVFSLLSLSMDFDLYLRMVCIIAIQICIYVFFVKQWVSRISSLIKKRYKEISYIGSIILIYLFLKFSNALNESFVSLTGVGYYNFSAYEKFITYFIMYSLIVSMFLMLFNLSILFYTILSDISVTFELNYLKNKFSEKKLKKIIGDIYVSILFIIYSIPIIIVVIIIFMIFSLFIFLWIIYGTLIYISKLKLSFFIDAYKSIRCYFNDFKIIFKIGLFLYSAIILLSGTNYILNYIISNKFINYVLYNFSYTSLPARCDSLQDEIHKKLKLDKELIKNMKGVFLDAEKLSIIIPIEKEENYIYLLGECNVNNKVKIFSKIEYKK